MTVKKISELVSSSVLTADDVFPIVETGVTKKIRADKIKKYVLGTLTLDQSTLGTSETSNEISLSADLTPTVDNVISLGSALKRWQSVHIGPGTLYIQDQNNLGLNAELTVVDGVLKVNGADQLQVGQLKFVNNTIESTTGNVDIEIGSTSSSANLVVNRNVVVEGTKWLFVDNMTSINAGAEMNIGRKDGGGGGVSIWRNVHIQTVEQYDTGGELNVDKNAIIGGIVISRDPGDEINPGITTVDTTVNLSLGTFNDVGNLLVNRNMIITANKTLTYQYAVGYQDGNQNPLEVLDQTKQVHTFADGTWILNDGVDGKVLYLVMLSGGSAEDIYIRVSHLRKIVGGQDTTVSNVLFRPFPYGGGTSFNTVTTMVFANGAWHPSQGMVTSG